MDASNNLEVFIKVMNGSDDSRGRKEILMCLDVLLCEQFLPIREWSCQDIDQDESDFGTTKKSFTVILRSLRR